MALNKSALSLSGHDYASKRHLASRFVLFPLCFTGLAGSSCRGATKSDSRARVEAHGKAEWCGEVAAPHRSHRHARPLTDTSERDARDTRPPSDAEPDRVLRPPAMPSSSNNVVTAGRTYLDLITSTPAKPQNALPARPKTKRERADENWKILVSRHRPACARSLLAPCAHNRTHGRFRRSRAPKTRSVPAALVTLCAPAALPRAGTAVCTRGRPGPAARAPGTWRCMHVRAFSALRDCRAPGTSTCPHSIWLPAASCVAGRNYQGVRTIPQGIGTASEVPGAPARGSAKNF